MADSGFLGKVAALLVLAALVLLACDARAQERLYGVDALALAKHNPRVLSEELYGNSVLGFLDATFGDPYPNLEHVLRSGKVVAVRAHLIDGTCIRNRVCEAGAPGYGDNRSLRARAQRLARFAAKYPAVKWYVSPFLEHDERNQARVQSWYQVLREAFPAASPVCSAFTGHCPRGVLIEKHGGAPGDITSPDGISHFDMNSEKVRNAGRLISFSWIPENNCRVSGEKTFTMPKRRVNCPTRPLIRQQMALLRPSAPRPVVAGCKPVGAPELLKTNAEYYGEAQDDGRGNKLLLISQKRYPKLELFTLGGRKVGHISYYGPFDGGGYRHYIGGRYGSNQNPVQLMNEFGGEWGLLRGGGVCYIVNAIRRQGTFR